MVQHSVRARVCEQSAVLKGWAWPPSSRCSCCCSLNCTWWSGSKAASIQVHYGVTGLWMAFLLGKAFKWMRAVSFNWQRSLGSKFWITFESGWQCLLNQGLKFEGPVRALRAPGEVVQTASFEPSSIGFAPQDIWRVECDPAGHWQDFGGSTCRGSCPICLQEWCLHGNPGLHNLFTRASWLQGVGEPGGD